MNAVEIKNLLFVEDHNVTNGMNIPSGDDGFGIVADSKIVILIKTCK